MSKAGNIEAIVDGVVIGGLYCYPAPADALSEGEIEELAYDWPAAGS
jgi:hypothetical protein